MLFLQSFFIRALCIDRLSVQMTAVPGFLVSHLTASTIAKHSAPNDEHSLPAAAVADSLQVSKVQQIDSACTFTVVPPRTTWEQLLEKFSTSDQSSLKTGVEQLGTIGIEFNENTDWSHVFQVHVVRRLFDASTRTFFAIYKVPKNPVFSSRSGATL